MPTTLSSQQLSHTLQSRTVAVLASLCAAAGLLTIWPSVQALYSNWTTDDLKTMSMVVPQVCYL